MTVRAPFGPMRGGSSGSWATRPGGCSSSKSRSCRFRNKTQKYRLMTRQFFSFLPSSSYFSIIMKINQSKVNIFLIVLSVSSFQPVMGIPCFLPSRIVSLSLPFRCQINFIKEWQWLAATWLFIYRKTDVLSPFWLCTTPSCSPPEKRLPPARYRFSRGSHTHTRQLFQTRFRLDDAGFLRFLAIPEGDKTNGNSSALFLPAAFTLNSVWLKRRRRKRRNNPTREGLAMTCIMSRLHPPVTFQWERDDESVGCWQRRAAGLDIYDVRGSWQRKSPCSIYDASDGSTKRSWTGVQDGKVLGIIQHQEATKCLTFLFSPRRLPVALRADRHAPGYK